jgi:WNK lysine deficient protein kinase
MEPRDYYIKGDEIGRGAYKIVYKAIDRRKGIEVAWNELDLHKDVEQRKLIQEIEILGTIANEYIIRFYEYWISDLKIIFVTELMTSGSLRSFLHTAGFVSIGAVKNWCRQILAGLDYLHRICNPPIIHRDIKLDNIFFHGATGQVI